MAPPRRRSQQWCAHRAVVVFVELPHNLLELLQVDAVEARLLELPQHQRDASAESDEAEQQHLRVRNGDFGLASRPYGRTSASHGALRGSAARLERVAQPEA